MKREILREAHLKKGWTLEQAAESIGVGRNTLWRWEQGMSSPQPHNRYQASKAYGLKPETSAWEESEEHLPFEREEASREATPTAHPYNEDIITPPTVVAETVQHDLELHLLGLIYDWIYRKKSKKTLATLLELQQRLHLEIESCDHMSEQNYLNHNTIADPGRRDALRRIALLPIQALGLGSLGTLATSFSWPSEDILTHCAAGITACERLAKGQHEDLILASWVLSTYIPVLRPIVKESSSHRQEAARLAGQALHLKTTLAVGFEGLPQAARYAEQALIYSKESGHLPLVLSILERTAWVYRLSGQSEKAVETMLEAQHLLEHAAESLPALVQSDVYGGVAIALAANKQNDEALTSLSQTHETFSASLNEKPDPALMSMMAYDLAHLYLYDGVAHYHLKQYDEALASFAKVVDPETLTPRMPDLAERNRVEIIGYQASASLKLPLHRKDKEASIHLLQAGIKGAKALRSEHRYNQALQAYELMDSIWSGDPDVLALREQLEHW
ncbi:MAG: helix-turn-helix transcriptional regulator [Ktedonobacteraceae bacterium]